MRFGSGKKQKSQHKQHHHQDRDHQKPDNQDNKNEHEHHGGHNHGAGKQGFTEKLLFWLAILSYIWLAGGIIVTLFVNSSGQ